MDFSGKKLHKSNIDEEMSPMKPSLPTYELYGENDANPPEFWLHCETIPSRSSLHHWEIQPHRHERFFQILYIEGGSADALFKGVVHPITPPAVVTVPPGVGHGFRFSKDIDGFVFTTLVSHLKTAPGERNRFGVWLSEPRLTPLSPENVEVRYVAETLKRLADEFQRRATGRNALLEAYLTTALTLAARLSAVQQEPTSDENERRMEVLQGLIQQHFRSHQPASFYARQLGISSTHLNRVVQASTGHSARELLLRKVADEAKRELVFTMASVQAIAFRLGFSDPAYFSRFFLRQTGQTPRAWRAAERRKIGM